MHWLVSRLDGGHSNYAVVTALANVDRSSEEGFFGFLQRGGHASGIASAVGEMDGVGVHGIKQHSNGAHADG